MPCDAHKENPSTIGQLILAKHGGRKIIEKTFKRIPDIGKRLTGDTYSDNKLKEDRQASVFLKTSARFNRMKDETNNLYISQACERDYFVMNEALVIYQTNPFQSNFFCTHAHEIDKK